MQAGNSRKKAARADGRTDLEPSLKILSGHDRWLFLDPEQAPGVEKSGVAYFRGVVEGGSSSV